MSVVLDLQSWPGEFEATLKSQGSRVTTTNL
jgi:hypothetical protein